MTILPDSRSAPEVSATPRLDMAGVPFRPYSDTRATGQAATLTTSSTGGGAGWWALAVVLMLLGVMVLAATIRSHNPEANSAAKPADPPAASAPA